MFGVVWDYYSSQQKGKQHKQNTSPKSYKTEIKILANPPVYLNRALNNSPLDIMAKHTRLTSSWETEDEIVIFSTFWGKTWWPRGGGGG